MKTALYFFLAMSLICFYGCTTSSGSMSNNSNKDQPDSVYNPDQTLDLTDHLRRFSGVQINGSGRNARITIRGVSSINLSSEPIFVVNGSILSGGLSEAHDLVRVEDIKTLRVLKSPSEVAMYGVRGSNGVIEIVLKN